MKKETTREEYPSQIKYREHNPSITFRLKRDDKERLDLTIATSGKRLSQWMTDFIHEEIDHIEEISELKERITFLQEYIKEVESEERFSIPCSICGKPLTLSSKHANWKTEIYPKTQKSSSPSNHIKSLEESKIKK